MDLVIKATAVRCVVVSISVCINLMPLLQNLERAANQQKAEMNHLTEQVMRLKQRASTDREALKQATRAQKQRAERCEDTAGHLSVQLQDMVSCYVTVHCY